MEKEEVWRWMFNCAAGSPCMVGGGIFFLKYIYTPGGGNKEFSHGIANSNKRIKIKLGNIKDEINRVVCPNFGHPAPTSSFTKYKIVFQHL